MLNPLLIQVFWDVTLHRLINTYPWTERNIVADCIVITAMRTSYFP